MSDFLPYHFMINKPFIKRATSNLVYLGTQLFKASLITGIAAISSAGLSACNGFDNNDTINIETQSAPSVQFCTTVSAPFSHTLCEVNQKSLNTPNSHLSLQLFWQPQKITSTQTALANTATSNNEGSAPQPLHTFNALLTDLPNSSSLKFAVNAGMYNTDFAPIGYTVIKGEQILSLNLKAGAGNFHLMPNGVLWWNKMGEVHITESKQLDSMLQADEAEPWFATQSGPMLVINNTIHPKFTKNSTSKKIRNGVGVCDDGNVKFVNSREPVTFYQFATLFKNELHCPNALFLDGGIASALYAPDIGIKDDKNMGVMVGLVDNQS